MATIGSLFVSVGVKTAELEKGLASAGKSVANFSKVGLAGIGAGLAVVGAGMATVGKASFDLSRDIEQSQNKLRAELGLSEAAAEEFGGMAKTIFANNFGADLDEATEAIIATRQQLGALSKDDLVAATENAFKLADAFDADIGQSLNAANVLMEKFGLTQGQAFDFIATGFQKGLNSSDDFLDSITEYGNLFGDAGADAGQFFSLMETGLQGGVLGTDKVADAFKEFQIRFLEGDKGMLTAIEDLTGDGWQMFIDEINSGDRTITDTFALLQNLLSEVADPIERNRIGIALMGTQFEDLGASAVTGIDLAKTGLDDMTGATDDLNAQYNNLGAFGQEMWRKTLLALTPVTDELLNLANEAMPFVRDLFEQAQPIISEFADTFGVTLKQALPVVGDALFRIGEALGIGGDKASGMDMILAGLTTTLNVVVTAVEATAVVFSLLADFIEGATSAAIDFKGESTNIAGKLGQINGAINPLFQAPQMYRQTKGLLGFATGGIVPGPIGAPQLAVVHGGESITPPGQSGGTNIYIDGINVGSSGNGGIDEALRMAFETLRLKLAT